MVLACNGSDDALTIITRAFVGPGDSVVRPPRRATSCTGRSAELQDARLVEVPFSADWRLDPARYAHPEARLAYLANPNSPSGTALHSSEVSTLAERLTCPLVVDEAYVDFADTHCIGLLADHPNVIVTRSFSKGYGLAGLRLGYLLARPEVVAGLNKVKDSYNCDALSLAGGAAALEDRAYLAGTRASILATRSRLAEAARALGYRVAESRANFVWCTEGPPAAPIYEALKARGILVRLMRYPGYPDGLRVTVGTDEEIDRLLDAWRPLVRP